MAITKELWQAEIIERLERENVFFNFVRREDENVLNGAVVHIPQYGDKQVEVTKNQNTFPEQIKYQGQQDIVYVLDTYRTKPSHIPNAELDELSYDKLQHILAEHLGTLSERIGDEMIIEWIKAHPAYINGSDQPIPAATTIATTGVSVGAHIGSGSRLKFVKEDLKAARKLFNQQNVSKMRRYALMSSEMIDQLLDDADLKNRDGVNGGELDMPNGVVPRLYGFDIIERSEVATGTSAGVVRDFGEEAQTTDIDLVLCWQADSLAAALGSVKVFDDTDNPAYYGDIYSTEQKVGGRKRRLDGKGVAVIYQGTP